MSVIFRVGDTNLTGPTHDLQMIMVLGNLYKKPFTYLLISLLLLEILKTSAT